MLPNRPGPWTLDKVKKRLRAEQLQRETLAAARYRLEEDQQRARVVKLIKSDKSFAVLMPISVTSEIARLENVDGERCHDLELAKKVSVMYVKDNTGLQCGSVAYQSPRRTFQSLLQQWHGRTRLE